MSCYWWLQTHVSIYSILEMLKGEAILSRWFMKSFVPIATVSILLVSSTVAFANSSTQEKVDQTRKSIKNAAYGYSIAAQDGEVAVSGELYPLLNKAKVNYNSTKAMLLKSTAKNKGVTLKDLDSLYDKQINKGVVPYIDAINYIEKYLMPVMEEVEQGELEKDWSKVEKAYHKLSVQLKNRTSILYRFSGKAARDLLLKEFKDPANAKRDQLMVPVTVYMKVTETEKQIKEGKITEAQKTLKSTTALLSKLPSIENMPMLEELMESLTIVSKKAGYELVLPKHLRTDATLTTFAGSGNYGRVEGKVDIASFRSPNSIISLSGGTVLVSDSKNQVIRKIKDGVVSTYSGITLDTDTYGNPTGGWHDGDKENAVFNNPLGMAVDSNDNIFLADASNNSIRKIAKDGKVTTVAGDGFMGNQDGVNARFNYPQDVAVAKDGTLYIADTLNHVIRKITTDGKVSTLNAYSDRIAQVVDGDIELAGDYADGKLVDAKFNEPSALAIDAKGNLYVSDSGNQLIRYIDFSANTVSTVAGDVEQSSKISKSSSLYVDGAFVNGSSLSARFNVPKGLVMTREGGLLIADSLNHAVRYLLNGEVTTVVGSMKERNNLLNHPTDITILPDGTILVIDSYSNSIKQFVLE